MTTIQLLRAEAIDRLHSITCDLPKYKNKLDELIDNFTIEETINLIIIMYKDSEFKSSMYYNLYCEYFDEIEELIINKSSSELAPLEYKIDRTLCLTLLC